MSESNRATTPMTTMTTMTTMPAVTTVHEQVHE